MPPAFVPASVGAPALIMFPEVRKNESEVFRIMRSPQQVGEQSRDNTVIDECYADSAQRIREGLDYAKFACEGSPQRLVTRMAS